MTRFDREFGVVFDGQRLKATPLERLRGYWQRTGSCTHRAVLNRIAQRPGGSHPRFLVRVDDYPRWDRGLAGFREFHSILAGAGIRYLLGVVPRPAVDPEAPGSRQRELTDEESELLQEIGGDVDVAVHGWSHRRQPGSVASEIVGAKAEELRRHAAQGVSLLEGLGFRPRGYIPPYNAIDRAGLDVLAGDFEAIFGGPESVRWLGCLPGPCRLGTTWYLPSYPPAYGRAGDVERFVRASQDCALPILIPVTLHWAWEEKDRFRALRSLAATLRSVAVSLPEWLDGAAWPREETTPPGTRQPARD